jgi:hypothetical protein
VLGFAVSRRAGTRSPEGLQQRDEESARPLQHQPLGLV